MYYWDSYWQARGLLVSELFSTVFDMMRNFRDLVIQFGKVPNGTRKYYQTRSQPPFFTLMVWDFYNRCLVDENEADHELLDSIGLIYFFLIF